MAAQTQRTARSSTGARRSNSSGQTKPSSGQTKRASGRRRASSRRRSNKVDTKLTGGVAAISAGIGAAAGALARPLVARRLRPARKGVPARIAELPEKANDVVKGVF